MYKLPPQRLGNLDESKRISFVRASEKPSTSYCGTSDETVVETGDQPGGSSDYWEIIENSRKDRVVKKEVKDEEPDVIVLDSDSDPGGSDRRKSRTMKKKTIYIKQKPVDFRDVNAFLKAAKDGNLAEVEKYLEMGVSIDSVDFFGWSALMCAVAEGNFEMSKYLLENRANPAFLDSRGKGIGAIAKENGHRGLIKRLFEHFCPNEDQSENTKNVEYMTICDACDVCIPTDRVDSHLTSITHQLNDEKAKGAMKYSGIVLGPSNIGYRLMCASGWTEEKGLGKNSDGSKFPIRTILKRNRTGLGLEKNKARVTHFGPYDPSAVTAVKKKKVEPIKPIVEYKKKKRKEDRIAKEFRSSFADSDSVFDYFNEKNK